MPRPERRLDEGDTALVRFASDLRLLRERAGRPSYRQLAAAAHYSVTTLSDAAGGRRLPTLPVTLAYVSVCGGDLGNWERRWHTLAADLASRAIVNSADSAAATTPYVGLAAFEKADADRFFGRDKLVDELLSRVREQRFIAVFGASGVGKSSVLRAGLLARWNSSTEAGQEYVLFTPGAHPLREYATAIGRGNGTGDVLVVVDQFEEIFTVCQDEAERAQFVDALVRMARDTDSAVRVVVGVRTDFYTHCVQDPALAELLRDGQFLVGPMDIHQMHSAIARPAALAGASVEAALLATVVADCTGQPGVLPLLSHALLETWQRRRGTTLTLSGYQAAGGIAHSIAQTAEHTYAAFDQRQQQLVKSLFLRLTAPSDITEDTKRRVSRDEVDMTDPAMTLVLERLASARLVTLDLDHIEITHEAVIRHWPRLRRWLAADREALRTHRQITEAANGWHELGRHRDALYQGLRLANALGCTQAGGVVLTARERDFLSASVSAQDYRHRVARRHTRRLHQLVGLLAAVATAAGVLAGITVQAQHRAALQRDLADAQAALAQTVGLQSTDSSLAWQLALAAERLAPTQQTRSAVLNTLDTPYLQRPPGLRNPVNIAAVTPDGQAMATTSNDDAMVTVWSLADTRRLTQIATVDTSAPVTSMALSPDGHTLATAHTDSPGNAFAGTQLWSIAARHRPTRLADLPGQWVSISFSGNGRLLIGGDQLWDITELRQPRRVTTLPGANGGVLNQAGQALATYVRYADGIHIGIRLWHGDATGRYVPERLITVPTGDISAVAFDPQSDILAIGTSSGATELWNVASPAAPSLVATFTAQSGVVTGLAFSLDGHALGSGTTDGSVSVWNVAVPSAWRAVSALAGQGTNSQSVVAMGFSPSGQRLTVAGTDHGYELVGLPEFAMRSSTGGATWAAVGPDGRLVATADQAGTQLWDLDDPALDHPAVLLDQGQGTAVAATSFTGGPVTFSPRGHLLTTTGVLGTRLWDVADARHPAELGTLAGPLSKDVFSPDGRLLVTESGPGEQFWDISRPRRPKLVTSLAGQIGPTAFSSDGRLMATMSLDGQVTLWNVTESRHTTITPTAYPTLVPEAETDSFIGSSIAFQPYSHVLAIGRPDGSVRLWNVTGQPGEVARIDGTPAPEDTIAFSPDGLTLATVGAAQTTRLWDMHDVSRPVLLAILTDAANPVEFTPDGHTLVVIDGDGSVQLRTTDEETAASRICGLGGTTITTAEWAQYFPDVPYQAPCAGVVPQR